MARWRRKPPSPRPSAVASLMACRWCKPLSSLSDAVHMVVIGAKAGGLSGRKVHMCFFRHCERSCMGLFYETIR